MSARQKEIVFRTHLSAPSATKRSSSERREHGEPVLAWYAPLVSDIERVEKALKHAKLPSWVESASAETMTDHTGEPAVRITIVVRADREDVVKNGAALSALSRKIHLAIDSAGVHLFPHTRFVGASEAA